MSKVILVTGASSGFGRMAANHLAKAGHIVYASMRSLSGRNAAQVAGNTDYARTNSVDSRTVELDVNSQDTHARAVNKVNADAGRIDVVVHNAGHMAYGPAEAFSPEQYIQLYDINVVGTQRLNRAASPHMRRQGEASSLWVGSTSTRGGTPPYSAPYFAAKAAMDASAVSYASESARWGIETTSVVPGAFT
ncbi:hypothetical protein OY671_007993 [Metschnikowia pulcherrima]|nr:hypothetical protein OY671_007993 [Metschnikowia pulcherrima]